MTVTPQFAEASTRAAIRGLRGLEQTAIMLEKWAPDIFPEVNEQGQKHFGRVMMEAAADAIRDAFKAAIIEVQNFPDDPTSLIDQYGKQRQTLVEIANLLREATEHRVDRAGYIREAHDLASKMLASNLVEGLPAAASFPYQEEQCPGHIAWERDPKICGYCGVHIDSLRPEDSDARP